MVVWKRKNEVRIREKGISAVLTRMIWFVISRVLERVVRILLPCLGRVVHGS